MAIKRSVQFLHSGASSERSGHFVDADGDWVPGEVVERHLNAQADYPNTDAARWHDVLERFEKLTGSVRAAQLKAMRVLLNSVRRELLHLRPSVRDQLPERFTDWLVYISVQDDDEQLLALLDESERE